MLRLHGFDAMSRKYVGRSCKCDGRNTNTHDCVDL